MPYEDLPCHDMVVMPVWTHTLAAIADRSLSMLMSASADEEAGVDGSSTDVPEFATMIEAHELVDVRMVLIRVTEGWPLVHGEVTLDAVAPMRDRTWQYPEDVFLD